MSTLTTWWGTPGRFDRNTWTQNGANFPPRRLPPLSQEAPNLGETRTVLHDLTITRTLPLWTDYLLTTLLRHLGYERVHLPLYKVADTPFHIQGDYLFLRFFNICELGGWDSYVSSSRIIIVKLEHNVWKPFNMLFPSTFILIPIANDGSAF